MAKIELKLPQMGESVAEATVTSWLKEIGDTIEADEAILEVATDKVDSEVPSEVEGILVEKFFNVDDVVKVGEVLAIIETEDDEVPGTAEDEVKVEKEESNVPEEIVAEVESTIEKAKEIIDAPLPDFSSSQRFYSPLVRNIAKEEGIALEELEILEGSGKEGRVTRDDILSYVEERKKMLSGNQQTSDAKPKTSGEEHTNKPTVSKAVVTTPAVIETSAEDEVVEMSRMGKIIASHMRESLDTSAHVQSFIEVDVTNIVNWRNRVKKEFETREGEKLTFTPIFMEVVAKTLKDYPLLNISVQGDKIIKKKNVNLGMATALPDGNLIVPVIKNADQLNLVGMAKIVNDLANRARLNQLKPDEIKDGTYTVTNIGSFGSVFGTPIINQPQVGILALGAIRKVPAVIETPEGDSIGIRHKMYLTHSYDHRVVNGALGGLFIKRVAEYLEGWNSNREI
ncbi:dihydrolipoamide acetyltransferase family protein [Abyssalbus ytuae]|uniref:Dihydrolipoamide acetyltransferase component of pyruvate dehydrogenase complex n=1 Tax=Abyssalbus ytuae TaxID=2926907 RepID=A0A9E7D2R3_9FLAO|nr:dihydrolipoamide acetyltransferase family protein [Abyssalbus ytuae]UOB16974.1 2-oxo acid dehydrogenase subunit E2 [Abyssalbus ytuae]